MGVIGLAGAQFESSETFTVPQLGYHWPKWGPAIAPSNICDRVTIKITCSFDL